MTIPDSVMKSIVGKIARQRGQRAEQLAQRLFQEAGWVCVRTRRGPVDVIAAQNGKVVLVQVKSGHARVSRNELKQLVEWGRQFDADAEVWHVKKRGKVERRRVFAAPSLQARPNP